MIKIQKTNLLIYFANNNNKYHLITYFNKDILIKNAFIEKMRKIKYLIGSVGRWFGQWSFTLLSFLYLFIVEEEAE